MKYNRHTRAGDPPATRQSALRIAGAAALASVLVTAGAVIVNQSGRAAGIQSERAQAEQVTATSAADQMAETASGETAPISPNVAAPATTIAAGVIPVDDPQVFASIDAAKDGHFAVVSELPRAVRHDTDRVRDHVRTPVPPQAVNESSCRTREHEAAMTIVIPDISYSCPVYTGDQSMLDSGAVTLISRPLGVPLSSRPGDPGILWIAGHRESHGGAFSAVPDLADGSIITVSDTNVTVQYRVVGRVDAHVDASGSVIDGTGYATPAATAATVVGPGYGPGTSRLVLQTCAGSDVRVLIYADIITG